MGEGRTEEEMVGGHHRLDEHEFQQILRDSEGQGRLAYCSAGEESRESLRLQGDRTSQS